MNTANPVCPLRFTLVLAAGLVLTACGGNPPPAQGYVRVCNSGEQAGAGSCPVSPVLGTAAGEWACTRDTTTGLLWEVKQPTGSGLRDWLNTYTSFDSTTQVQQSTNLNQGFPTQAQIDAPGNAAGYARALNGLTSLPPLCGKANWRVPTRPELRGLVLGTAFPFVDAPFFPNTIDLETLTSTPHTVSGLPVTNAVAVVSFFSGSDTGAAQRDTPRSLRLVASP